VLNARDAVKSVAAERRAIDIVIAASGGEVQLEVRDQGPGVPPELIEQIFHPFVTTKEGHAGLGLATVQSSMKHFGGRVEIVDPPGGRGAWFRLTFNASLERSAGTSEVAPPKARRLRILVVDDEPEFVAVVRETLVQDGHEVIGADNGDDALNKVAHDRFDVILMDLGLPRRNGLEVVRAMRGEGISSKIVLMTGWDGEAVGADPRITFCDTVLQTRARRRSVDAVPELIGSSRFVNPNCRRMVHGQAQGWDLRVRNRGRWLVRNAGGGERGPRAGAVQPARRQHYGRLPL
jgi:CheY-like chemotaxis protein